MGEDLNSVYEANVTIISNEFLEKYLADSNSDYLKVYLFYLWKRNQKLSVKEVADELNLTDNDVERAIKYWIKQKAIQKKNVQDKNVLNKNDNSDESSIDNSNDNNKNINFENVIKMRNAKNKVEDQGSLEDVMFYAEKMLPNISSNQAMLFEYLFNEYKFSSAVIQYLIDYCVDSNKTDNRYMRKIATSWYELGLKTVDDIKKNQEEYLMSKSKTRKRTVKNNEIIDNKRSNDYYDNIFEEEVKKRMSKVK